MTTLLVTMLTLTILLTLTIVSSTIIDQHLPSATNITNTPNTKPYSITRQLLTSLVTSILITIPMTTLLYLLPNTLWILTLFFTGFIIIPLMCYPIFETKPRHYYYTKEKFTISMIILMSMILFFIASLILTF